MTDIARLLSALEGVVDMKNNKWHAICPNHTEHNPSLIVRERHDGKILIYCHAGCSADSVLKAIGLRWGDIHQDRWHAAYARGIHAGKRQADSFGQILDIDRTVLKIAAFQLRNGAFFSIEDQARIEIAKRRLSLLDNQHGV